MRLLHRRLRHGVGQALRHALTARFRLDPRDLRTDDDYYDLIGDDEGIFGCMSLLGCHDVCPKQLPLQTQIAYMRRKMAMIGLS